MKKIPKVSIIVPIYNVEKYLSQCLESICKQTLKDIEIICVNDGSTDGSADILKKYQEKDGRIKCITKENSGYGDSMNKGFAEASGEYIGIVESDDFVEPKMFEELYFTAIRNDADIVKSNFWLYWDNSGKNELYQYFSEDENNKIIEPSMYNGGSLFLRKMSIWSAIYRKKFIVDNKIQFLATSGASFQDTAFTFKAFSYAKRLVCLTDAYLHYRQDNANSSINSMDKKIYCIFDEYEEIERFINKNLDKKKIRYSIYGAMFYDTCIWTYEGLSYTKRYEFLLYASTRLKSLVRRIGSENFAFGDCWWKWRDLKRIIEDPFEYHLWRNVERYEQKRGVFQYKTPYTHINNLKELKKVRESIIEKPAFSIIVPIYNCEKFIRSALESLWLQTYDNFEVICVNDGSTDHSLSIIEEYTSIDNRFIVINQENHGTSAARNAGLEIAKGEYILFLDSDDYYSQNACKRLYDKIALGKKADMLIFGTEIFPSTPKASDWHYQVLSTPDTYYKKITEEELLTVPYLKIYSWRCCFRREFLNNYKLRFMTNFCIGEDALFLFEALLKCNGVSVISDKLYNYRHYNSDSLMNITFKNPIEYANQQMRVLEQLLVVGKQNNVMPSKELMEYCCDFIYTAVSNCPEPEKYTVVKKFVQIIKKNNLDKFMEAVSDNCEGFYLYCLNEQKNAYLPGKLRRNIKAFLLKFIPPSRRAFYDYSIEILNRLDMQQQHISYLQQQIQAITDIMNRQEK